MSSSTYSSISPPQQLTLSLLPFSLLPASVSFPLHRGSVKCVKVNRRVRRFARGEEEGAELLRKPTVVTEGGEREEGGGGGGEREGWVDWEDQILEDTVPLVGFVRMLLHSGKYESGDKLSPEHEKTILERLLPHHPEWEKKIGVGVDYITVGYHPNFESSRCLFIVRKDGEIVDFSYWKCIKGLIKKNYPLYADSFILRHFRRRSRND